MESTTNTACGSGLQPGHVTQGASVITHAYARLCDSRNIRSRDREGAAGYIPNFDFTQHIVERRRYFRLACIIHEISEGMNIGRR